MIFICYSHVDEKWETRLVKQLKFLEDLIDVWDDRMIGLGEEWYKAIEKAIKKAHVAILLISDDFYNSNFITKKEVPLLFERREKEGLLIIPLIVRSCPWEQIKWLSPIQAWPRNGKVLSNMPKNKYEAALTGLATEIAQIIESANLNEAASTMELVFSTPIQQDRRNKEKDRIIPPESVEKELKYETQYINSKREQDIKNEFREDFLIEDFKDTSEHLRATDKKFEFLFQMYGGFFILFIPGAITLISITLKDIPQLMIMVFLKNLLLYYGLPIILLTWFITLWMFEFLLRGLTMKTLYVNRLNFLRRKIYLQLDDKITDNSVFLYINKVLPNDNIKKVNMGDMFLIALRWIIIGLWIILCGSLFFIFNDFLSQKIALAIFISVFVIIFVALVFLTKKRWQKTLKETKLKIEKSWE